MAKKREKKTSEPFCWKTVDRMTCGSPVEAKHESCVPPLCSVEELLEYAKIKVFTASGLLWIYAVSLMHEEEI